MSRTNSDSECLSESTFEPSTLVELLRWRAQHQPDQRAYTFLADGESEQGHLTYRELDQQTRTIGAWLQSLEASHERVLLLYPPGLMYIAAFFGCLYAGAVAVPVYPPRPNRTLLRLQAIVADAQAKVVLTTGMILSRVQGLLAEAPELETLRWLTTDSLDSDLAEAWRDPALTSDTLAFLQFTSGSTASPRGVMVSHGNLLHNQRVIRTACQHTEQSSFVSWLPVYHDMGLIGTVIQPLYLGAPCVLMSPEAFLQKPLRWLQAISRYKAHTSGGPNFAYDLCVRKIDAEQRATLDLSRWSVAFNGSEPINHETLERFVAAFEPCGFRPEAFYPCYGLAEATLLVSGGAKTAAPVIHQFKTGALERNRVVSPSGETDETRTLVSCGRSGLDQTICIVDPESLTRCRPDQVGEIWVSGPSVGQGYWNRPDETETTFRAYVADTGEGPFLRTGDLGFLRDGELFVTGRLKDLIIIRGRNHYPHDIERTVERSHPALRPGCSAAFSVEKAGEERLVVVQEVERHSQDLDVEKMAGAIRQAVAETHELQVYDLVFIKPGSLPKTSSGKIQHQACRAHYLKGSLEVLGNSLLVDSDEDEAAGSEDSFIRRILLTVKSDTERQSLMEFYLQDQMARMLKVAPSRLDRRQPLTALGLDSLLAIELKNRIEVDLGVVVTLSEFIETPSLVQLAAQILDQLESAAASSPGSLTPVDHGWVEYPLSSVQHALWFLYELAPESAAYNIVLAARICSEIDTAALRRAFQRILDRHAALRTTFATRDGRAVQVVHQHQRIPFEATDASGWNWDSLNQHLVEEAHQPFDLERGPLLRVKVFARSSHEHILVLTVHHIAIDAWSLWLMLDELRVLYAAEQAGAPASLPAVTRQYTDYVRWQRDLLASPEGERLLAFWLNELGGELLGLNLATDRPRPPIRTFAGNSHGFRLDHELVRQLKALAGSEGATLYMVLLAAFHVLLYRYTGQDDLLIGSPMSGRSRVEFQGVVGCLFNPVPLRADLSGDPRFTVFLDQVRRTVLRAWEHQDYPSHLLAEHLQSTADPSRSPLYPVMFIFQKPHRLQETSPLRWGEMGIRVTLGRLEMELLWLEKRVARSDLELELVEAGDSLLGWWQYNTDLFEPATTARMAEHFHTLLESLVAHPQQRVSQLALVTEAERQQLLIQWGQTKIDGSDGVRVHQWFEAQVQKTPHKVAAVYNQDQLTFQKLNEQATQLANLIARLRS